MLSLISTLLQIAFYILKVYINWTSKERTIFDQRMKMVSNLLKEAIENREEALNEEAYLSNLEWESKQRFTTYKEQILDVLRKGGGIKDLEAIELLGMGLRVEKKEAEIIQILTKDLDIEEKSKRIAKVLLEI